MKAPKDFDAAQLERYSRHLILPEIGISGQRKLRAARVLLVGAGGLGSPVALYLASAGVGAIGIVDSDAVELSNLQRQIIHSTQFVGISKVASAASRIREANPAIEVISHETRLTAQNVLSIIGGYDIIVDGSDNFPTRYVVNDACTMAAKPNVYGAVYRFEGQASVFDARSGPCYRCLFPEPPTPGTVPSCEEAGVLGVLPGIIGLIQATETIKLIVGIGEPLIGRLLLFDALALNFREMRLHKNQRCPLCGPNPTITEIIDAQNSCEAAAGSLSRKNGSMQTDDFDIEPRELESKLARADSFELLDVRDDYELEICKLPYTKQIPVVELSNRLSELDPRRPTVVYCRSGARSAKAVELLRRSGFEDAKNLKGGILAWIRDVEPALSKY